MLSVFYKFIDRAFCNVFLKIIFGNWMKRWKVKSLKGHSYGEQKQISKKGDNHFLLQK